MKKKSVFPFWENILWVSSKCLWVRFSRSYSQILWANFPRKLKVNIREFGLQLETLERFFAFYFKDRGNPKEKKVSPGLKLQKFMNVEITTNYSEDNLSSVQFRMNSKHPNLGEDRSLCHQVIRNDLSAIVEKRYNPLNSCPLPVSRFVPSRVFSSVVE